MNDFYYSGGDPSATATNIGFALAGILLMIYLVFLAVGVLMYVLQSVALFKIAKKRGIPNYGLAWVPIGSSWLLGKIADDVNICRRNKKTNFAKNLLWLNLAPVIGIVLIYVVLFILLIGMLAIGDVPTNSTIAATGIAGGLGVLIYLATLAVAVIASVITYMALYRVYYGYAEDNAVIYLVLSIFFSMLQPIFLFMIRNRDLLPPDPTSFPSGGYYAAPGGYPPPPPPPYDVPPPPYGMPVQEPAPAVEADEAPVNEEPVIDEAPAPVSEETNEINPDREDNKDE